MWAEYVYLGLGILVLASSLAAAAPWVPPNYWGLAYFFVTLPAFNFTNVLLLTAVVSTGLAGWFGALDTYSGKLASTL